MFPQWPASQQLSTIVYLLLLFWWSWTKGEIWFGMLMLSTVTLLHHKTENKTVTRRSTRCVRSTVSISLENPSPVSQQCLALWVQTKSIRCASSLPPSLLPTLQTPMSFLDYGVISISDCLSPSPSWACLWAQADLPTTYLPPHHNVVLTMWPYVVDKRIRELCHSSISISFKGHMLFWGKNKLRTANKQICKFHIAHCRIWARGTNQPLYNLTYFI